jgi:PIN domain nuclease of toxin-antitoxin system
VTAADLAALRDALASSSAFVLYPIDLVVVDATATVPRDLLSDPWDRLIVGTARALAAPLVTRDRAIRDSQLVPTIW